MSRSSLFGTLSALILFAASLLENAPVVHADYPISPGFPYGSQKVRGVATGGWFILHPWITPSLFENTGNTSIIDEYTFCEYQDKDVAKATLEHHWDTFYSEDDFAGIAAAGLTHIKIPIGYWAYDVQDGEPYVQGQLPYLERAIGWAEKYGLKIVLDLYGAPGSQNGFINSGQILDYPGWHTNQSYIDRTTAIIKQLESTFAKHTNVVPVIGPLNEPAGFLPEVLPIAKQFYLDSYTNIRFPYNTSKQSNTVIMLHDGFQELSDWSDFMTTPDYQGVAMDTHIYQGFNDVDLVLTDEEQITHACAHAANLSSFHLWTIVGEWSTARTDCAKYLRGRNYGARYDGTYPNSTYIGSCDGRSGSAANFTDDYKTFMRRFWEAQVTTYESGAGWIQWPWKTEEGAGEEWSYIKGLEYGWIPQDPTERKFTNVCG